MTFKERIFVIGDIHGCYDELMELLQQANVAEQDRIISVGDIVDRGNKSKEVFEFFRDRKNSKVLMGNHERKHLNHVLSYAQEIVRIQFGNEYPEFLKWLSTLDYYDETDEVIIVHAAFEHDKTLTEQKQPVLCGSTAGERVLENKYAQGTFWTDHYRGSKPIIYGHRVVGEKPELKNNTWGIDTGCCHGDYLTALELPGFIIHQVKAKKDYWKEEQRRWQIPVLDAKDWNNMEFTAIRKQLAKLSYVEDAAVREYLSAIENRIRMLENLFPEMKSRIDQLAQQLREKFPDSFNEEANEFPFKTLLFKSKANNLKTEDFIKTLNTPAKAEGLARSLEIEPAR